MDLSARVEYINQLLEKNLPDSKDFGNITEAMSYSVLNGGKRIRAIMLIETAKLYTNDEFVLKNIVETFAVAIECIHAYSLVHDDLPAMDNDVIRRGMPTTHVKFGHAMGVLAGDALLNYAYEIVANVFSKVDELQDDKKKLELYRRVGAAQRIIARKPGYSGMIGGQVLDTDVDYPFDKSNKDTEANIEKMVQYGIRIYELKTSQLLEIALMCGAILGGADFASVESLEQIGYCVGIAFQVQDDVLDMTSSAEVLGKSVNIDERNEKPTVARLLGLEKAKALVENYTDDAVSRLDGLNRDTDFLKELFISLINRKK